MQDPVKRIIVVVKRAGEDAAIVDVDNSLDGMRALVDGGYLEAVPLRGHSLYAYVDEDGIGKQLPHNIRLNGHEICGPVVLCRCDSRGFDIGLEPNEAARLAALLSRDCHAVWL